MTGVVTDPSGALIQDATVVLSNSRTGVRFNATTDSKGSYSFANVPPSPGYTAVFSKAGFASVSVRNIALQVGLPRTQNAQLTPGANATVEVSGRAEDTLNTTDATIGNNIDPEELNELPVQNRQSISVLFQLQPGVADGSVTGARSDQNNVTIDGMDVNDIAAGTNAVVSLTGGGIVGGAPVDAIQEFRGVVGGLVPSIGTGSGGQFQLVTKDGTNSFHGNINEYHRDTATAANTWFNNNTGLPRTPLIRNQFGGNIGGPIKKDKVFFFFNFLNSRIIQSTSVARIVPLDSFRNGNIAYIRNTDPVTGQTCAATSRQNTTPNCIGMLTPAQVRALDPAGIGEDTALLSFINTRYPHANDLTAGDGINTGYYRFNTPTPDFIYNYIGRVDYNITPRQRLFGSFAINREDSTYSAIRFPGDPNTNPYQDRSYRYVVSHVWQIGGNKVNQAYYGDTVSKYNFPSLYNPTGVSQFGFGGSTNTISNLASPYNSGSSQRRRVPVPEVRDDFNWQLGSHNLGFGGTFKFIKTNSNLVNDFTGVTLGLGGENLTLDPSVRPADIRTAGTTAAATYDEAFALALGRIASVGSNYNYTASGSALPEDSGATRRYRYFETELYFGDSWKIAPKLTLTYGLRYQLYSVPYEANGVESIQNTTFDQYFGARRAQSASGISGPTALPAITYNLGGKANNAAPLYQPSYKDFAPRLAFAYSPAPRTVINGSAAVIFDRTVINAVNFIQDQSSYLFQNSVTTQYGSTSAVTALKNDPRLGSSLGYTNPNTPSAIVKPYSPYIDDASGSVTGVPHAPYGLASNQFNTIVDPTLKDPYSLAFNAGVEQQFPGRLVMKLNYAGRFGRRLLAQADASQLVDFPDKASGQTMAQAFANLTQEVRAGRPYTPQPFFENQIGRGYTVAAARAYSSLVANGDFADYIQALQAGGYLDYNVGMASQFAENTYVTNKGNSSYNGLLFTLEKDLSQGLKFHFNYTFSHSIDNVSAPANYISSSAGINFICDATNSRECRANSDFDVQNIIISDFLYNLPVGRGKQFLGSSSHLLDELIGGWSVSAIPGWRSGIAYGLVSNAYVAGYANNAPPIFNGKRNDVKAHVRKDPTTGTVWMYGSQTAATRAQSDFTGPIGLTIGSRNNLRGPSAFTMDAGLGKRFPIIPEKLTLRFRADFFNVLNHPVFSAGNNDITSGAFGQVTAASPPRVGQFSLRLEF